MQEGLDRSTVVSRLGIVDPFSAEGSATLLFEYGKIPGVRVVTYSNISFETTIALHLRRARKLPSTTGSPTMFRPSPRRRPRPSPNPSQSLSKHLPLLSRLRNLFFRPHPSSSLSKPRPRSLPSKLRSLTRQWQRRVTRTHTFPRCMMMRRRCSATRKSPCSSSAPANCFRTLRSLMPIAARLEAGRHLPIKVTFSSMRTNYRWKSAVRAQSDGGLFPTSPHRMLNSMKLAPFLCCAMLTSGSPTFMKSRRK